MTDMFGHVIREHQYVITSINTLPGTRLELGQVEKITDDYTAEVKLLSKEFKGKTVRRHSPQILSPLLDTMMQEYINNLTVTRKLP